MRFLTLFLCLVLTPVAGRAAVVQLGIISVAEDPVWRDTDTEVDFYPGLTYLGERFRFVGAEASWRLTDREDFELGLVGVSRHSGYDENDGDFLRGMDDRDRDFNLGLRLGFERDWGELKISLLRDIASTHEGGQLELEYEYPIQMRSTRITPSIGISWQSSHVNDYYYGVEADEATANRAEYEADRAAVIQAGIQLLYPFAPPWIMIGGLSADFLPDEITDSPIVEDDVSYSLFIGILRTL